MIHSDGDVIRENIARFINTLTSFSAGRAYMSLCDILTTSMLKVLRKANRGSLTSENFLGALQKLSLRLVMHNFYFFTL